MRLSITFLTLAALAVCLAVPTGQPATPPELAWFFQATSRNDREASEALSRIAAGWRDGYASMIIDLARLMRPARRFVPEAFVTEGSDTADVEEAGPPSLPFGTPGAAVHPSSIIRGRLIRFLEKQTGNRFGDDLHRWREWMWKRPYDPHPEYATFKGQVYAQIDRASPSSFAGPCARHTSGRDRLGWRWRQWHSTPRVSSTHPSRRGSLSESRSRASSCQGRIRFGYAGWGPGVDARVLHLVRDRDPLRQPGGGAWSARLARAGCSIDRTS